MSESPLPVSARDLEADVFVSPSQPIPLAIGTTLLDRFTITAFLTGDTNANVYRVAQRQPCPNCGVENEGSAAHCGFCGQEMPTPHTLILLERPLPADGQAIPTSFMLHGLSYALAPDVPQVLAGARAPLHQTHSFATDPGIVRSARGDPNEDSVLALQLTSQHSAAASNLSLFIVADGVGGAAAGEVASQIAIETVSHASLNTLLAPSAEPLSDEAIYSALRAAIHQANARIIAYAQTRDVPVGTTVTLALIRNQRAFFANVGDSRIYLFRDDVLTQISRDHSYVAQLVEQGEISPDEIRVHPQRNIILRSLGDATGFDVDIFPPDAEGLEFRAGDQLLLCSDGLWEMVEDQEIAGVLEQELTPAQSCAELVSFANAAGGADNISLVVVKFKAL